MNPKGMGIVSGVYNTARESHQHPDHPDKPDWMVYLVLKSHTLSDESRELHKLAVEVKGNSTDPIQAKALLDFKLKVTVNVTVKVQVGSGRQATAQLNLYVTLRRQTCAYA